MTLQACSGVSTEVSSTATVVCVRTGLSVYDGSTVTVVCVRTGLSAYAGSTVTGGLVSGLVCPSMLVVW